MPLSDHCIEKVLLEDPGTPWAVNVSDSGDRMINVNEWLTWATERSGGDRAELERMTDQVVNRLGGQKLEVHTPGAYLRGIARRLVGPSAASDESAYTIPSHPFGEARHTVADQIRTANAARARQK